MKNFKKIAALVLAAVTAMSVMSVTALAAEDTMEAEYGTVDSIDELSEGSISYTTDENGDFVLKNANDGILPLGSSTPPSTIGTSTKIYLYGTGSSGSSSILMNTDTSFKFSFDSSCTTSTTQYAEFLVGATSTTKKIYFEGSGGTDTKVNIRLKSMTSGVSDISSKELPIHSSNYDYVYFKGLKNNATYAIEITPVTAGKAISGTINVSGDAF